jgi:hypothetical protein
MIAVLGLLISGCSYTDFTRLLPAVPSPLPPPATATPTIYLAPTKTAAFTPTQPTPTFTSTPTLIYLNGRPAAPSLTPDATTAPAVLLSSTPTDAAQPLLGNGPFSTILVSGRQLYWGSCEPSAIKATVKVAPEVGAFGVLIMLRLKDTKTDDTTDWGGGAIMDKQGNGVFTYTLTAKSFTHYRDYLKAWGQYQFVAYDANLHRLGGSAEYLSNLTIEPCP